MQNSKKNYDQKNQSALTILKIINTLAKLNCRKLSYLASCFLVLLPESIVGLIFSYLGFGFNFLSRGGILGLGFVLNRLISIFVLILTDFFTWLKALVYEKVGRYEKSALKENTLLSFYFN